MKTRPEQQTNDEWLAEYDVADANNTTENASIVGVKANNTAKQPPENIRKTGIIRVRMVSDRLLITTDRPITNELDKRIKSGIRHLVKIAEADTGEYLYLYAGYRTLFSDRKPCLALAFKEIHTNEIVQRYFNIELRNSKGNSFKTGDNGEFRIVGNTQRPIKGSFIKFWLDIGLDIPDDRPSHIHRYMNSKLSGVVVSCPNPVPHHGDTKLKTLNYEGRLYEITCFLCPTCAPIMPAACPKPARSLPVNNT